MAKDYKRAKDMPIYTAQQKFERLCIEIMVHTTKDLKHTICHDLVHEAREQLKLIAKAKRNETTRAEYLEEFLDNHYLIAQTIKDLVELQALQEKYYLQAIPLIANIERQAGGWFKSTQAVNCQRPD